MEQRETAPLIPRKVLFGNPDRANPALSPDGTGLAYLAPLDGVLNVWVGPAEDLSSAKAGHPRLRSRDPFLRLGLYQQSYRVHPGQSRRRKLADVCRGPDHRANPRPHPSGGSAGPSATHQPQYPRGDHYRAQRPGPPPPRPLPPEPPQR